MRLIALLIVLIPGIFGVIGIKLMRDVLFGVLNPPFTSLIVQFILGLVFLIVGLSFVGGFIFYRDRKRNKVQDRFSSRSPKNGSNRS
ncbi:DUF2627 domain-containing protein [Pseudalkalibacillus hwajinpoensis]|uniref:DUF2627 domain-containing protein n=1 Tax=Guptibacillus hwajinpoensis TaxID=208199 RepID=A0A4U1MH58_9BACL|nr:DUF2627 domain-containing protein [Pseudalkalibacillus hwajinpoensis]TKD70051.1 DUF2627 domain-containing protein [Pseudalkalibacillus hwajinpoensis]